MVLAKFNIKSLHAKKVNLAFTTFLRQETTRARVNDNSQQNQNLDPFKIEVSTNLFERGKTTDFRKMQIGEYGVE